MWKWQKADILVQRWNYRTALDVPRAKKEAPLSWTLYWKSFFRAHCPSSCLLLQHTSTWKQKNLTGYRSSRRKYQKHWREKYTPAHVCPCRSQWGDPVHEEWDCTGGSDPSEVSLSLRPRHHRPLLPHHSVSASPYCPAVTVKVMEMRQFLIGAFLLIRPSSLNIMYKVEPDPYRIVGADADTNNCE